MVPKQHKVGPRSLSIIWILLGLLVVGFPTERAAACSFCIAESQTLSEEFESSSVVLLAKMIEAAPAAEEVRDSGVPYGFVDPTSGAAKFKIIQVFKGEEHLEGKKIIEAIYFGEPDEETVYLIRGLGTPPEWNLPLPLTPIAVDYIPKLFDIPTSGGDRLAFFQDYLEHEDSMLSQDAYDEFARSPNSDLIELGDRMDRAQLIEWIESTSISPSRRRLFLLMLGICGNDSDRQRVEAMILSDIRMLDPAAELGTAVSLVHGGPWGAMILPEINRMYERQRKLGLDAMIACYLMLSSKEGAAEQGLAKIDKRFLTDSEAEFTHVYASLLALRFLGDEQTDLIPIDRVIQSARHLLESDEFADQVITDLSRWKDWETLPRLFEMFKISLVDSEKYQYVREPIVTYLDVASEQGGEVADQAKEALAWIEEAHPESVTRARKMAAFGFLLNARQSSTPPPVLTEDGMFEDGSANEGIVEVTEDAIPAMNSNGNAEEPPKVVRKTSEDPLVAKNQEEAGPPGKVLLITVPLAAAVVCYGLFWWILRGGAS